MTSEKKSKIINYITFVGILIVLVMALLNKTQKVNYELASNSDMQVSLSPGDVVMQTYDPNRRHITGFTYRLVNVEKLQGTYTLYITYSEGIDDNSLFIISNSYDGENANELTFKLDDEFNPEIGKRLSLFLVSDGANQGELSLSADSSFRSFYIIDEFGKKTLGDGTLDLCILSVKPYKWLMLMCILLYTFGISFLIMHFLKTEFEETVVISIVAAVLLAYCFGMIGLFKYINIALIILSLCGVFCFLCVDDVDVFLFKKISFSYLIWLFIVLILVFAIKMEYIGDPDSVFYTNRVKYMFYTDKLVTSTGYSFLLPVLAYILESINGIFSESIFLLAIKLYEFAIIFSFCGKFAKRNDILAKILILALSTILAIGIHPEVYLTSMMDIPFALTVAYVIDVIYSEKICRNFIVKTIAMTIALFMIKRAGIPVLLIITIIQFVHAIRYRGSCKINFKYIEALVLIFFVTLVLYKGIDLYTDRHDTNIEVQYQNYIGETQEPNTSAPEEIIDTTQSTLNSKLMQVEPIVVKKLIYAFLSTPIYYGFSYGQSLGLFFIIAALIWLYKKNDSSRDFLIDVVELVMAAGLYYFAIAYKYLFAIEEGGQYSLNAYDRYAIHFIGAISIYVVVKGIEVLLEEKKHSGARWYIGLGVAVGLFSIITEFVSVTEWINLDTQFIEAADDDLKRALSLYAGYEHNIFVYVAPDTFTESGYYGKNMQMNTYPAYANGSSLTIDSKDRLDSFTSYLCDNVEYFYLVNFDSNFVYNACGLFEDGENGIKRHSFYYVNKHDNGSVMLEYLGQTALNDFILKTEDSEQ